MAKIVPEVSAKVETYDLTDKEESESSLANQLAVSDLVAQYLWILWHFVYLLTNVSFCESPKDCGQKNHFIILL